VRVDEPADPVDEFDVVAQQLRPHDLDLTAITCWVRDSRSAMVMSCLTR